MTAVALVTALAATTLLVVGYLAGVRRQHQTVDDLRTQVEEALVANHSRCVAVADEARNAAARFAHWWLESHRGLCEDCSDNVASSNISRIWHNDPAIVEQMVVDVGRYAGVDLRCGLCGRPAVGWAFDRGVRYCHYLGDEQVTCYEMATQGEDPGGSVEV